MNAKNLGVSVVVSVVVVIVGLYFFGGSTVERVIEKENLGAIPGSSIEGKYLTVGGVNMAYITSAFPGNASTTLCTMKNPFSKDAQLVSFSVKISSSTNATAAKASVSTSTNAFLSATTSPTIVFEKVIPIRQTSYSFNWVPRLATGSSTTATSKLFQEQEVVLRNGESPFFLRSTEYVGIKVATSTPGKEYQRGTCRAIFQEI